MCDVRFSRFGLGHVRLINTEAATVLYGGRLCHCWVEGAFPPSCFVYQLTLHVKDKDVRTAIFKSDLAIKSLSLS